jgi:hypothetical protein
VSGPVVSVVVPLHNGAGFLDQTLRSVAEQTVGRDALEVIVVDDGSTDDGIRLATGHACSPTVISQRNLGVAVARNHGAAVARGRWLTFLDQDDLWHPTRIERLLSWVDDNPEARVVATTEIPFAVERDRQALRRYHPALEGWPAAYLNAGEEYSTLTGPEPPVDVSGTGAVEAITTERLLSGPITMTTSVLYQRTTAIMAGLCAVHARAMDDYWLLVNASHIEPVVKVDMPTVFYRVHAASASRGVRLALPYLSAQAALRWGGIHVDPALTLGGRPDVVPPRDNLLEGLIDELIHSTDWEEDARVRTVLHRLVDAAFPAGPTAQRLHVRLRRAEIARRLGDLAPSLRSARDRLRRPR